MNMEKCKYLLFCGTLALWMAGSFQQVYAATEPSSQAIQQQSNKVTGKVSDATGPIIGASVVEKELPTERLPIWMKFQFECKSGSYARCQLRGL